MILSPALMTALWAGGITAALILAAVLAGALFGRLRHGPPVRRLPAHLLGMALLLAVPLAFAVPLAALGGAALRAAGTAPLVYPFVTLAASVCLGAALKANGYGMEGCTKMFGVFTALYIAVWGAVAFVA